MIVLDIETSGLTERHGICQIGGFEFENPKNNFLQDCRIDDEDEIMEGAIKANGRDESILRDISKQSQEQLLINYLNWVEKIKEKILLGVSIGWDISMIQGKCLKYGFWGRFSTLTGHNGIDLSTIAQSKYKKIYRNYLVNESGKNKMGLSNILKFCGLEDKRVGLSGYKIVKEGEVHDALEDAKLAGECFSRIDYGSCLFDEYSEFPIPDYLRK